MLFFSFLIWCLCRRPRISASSNKDIAFVISRNYVLLPIQNNARELKVNVYIDGVYETNLDLRLAVDHVDFLFPYNSANIHKKTLSFSVAGASDSDIFWSEIRQSDQYEINYYEKYRPYYHFTPEYGWMNDPNGMFFLNGLYHFHFQYNPYATVWGNMHWGHSVSSDLINWKYWPFSIAPDRLGQIFSGSSIVDENNFAGFGENAVLSYFTSAGQFQQQSLAVSTDNGSTFTKYENNPIIPNSKIPDFRDPKVVRINESFYVMCLAVGNHIEFWGSNENHIQKNGNLINWEYLSSFGENYGAHGGVWECPDLLIFEERHVLLVNINPGGPFGGSACQYFVGHFDGKYFKCDDQPETTKWLDFGRDAYATVTYPPMSNDRNRNRNKNKKMNENDEVIAMTWMSNWNYANDVPSVYFRSAIAIPRKLNVVKLSNDLKNSKRSSGNTDWRVSNLPIASVDQLRGDSQSYALFDVNENKDHPITIPYNTPALEIDVEIDFQEAEHIGIKLSNSNNKGETEEEFVMQLEKRNDNFLFSADRTKSGNVGFSEAFPSVTSCAMPEKKLYKWRIFVDACSIEFFDEDGVCTMTNLVFPLKPYKKLSFFCNKGKYTVNHLSIYNMTQVMHPKEKKE